MAEVLAKIGLSSKPTHHTKVRGSGTLDKKRIYKSDKLEAKQINRVIKRENKIGNKGKKEYFLKTDSK